VSYPVQSLRYFFFSVLFDRVLCTDVHALHNKYNNIISIYYYPNILTYFSVVLFWLMNRNTVFNHLKRLTAKNDLLLLFYYYYHRCAFYRHCYYRFTFSWLKQKLITQWCANWRTHTYYFNTYIHHYILVAHTALNKHFSLSHSNNTRLFHFFFFAAPRRCFNRGYHIYYHIHHIIE